jgi:hypothetical protein
LSKGIGRNESSHQPHDFHHEFRKHDISPLGTWNRDFRELPKGWFKNAPYSISFFRSDDHLDQGANAASENH